VGCSAHDALGRAAVCSFNVTLTTSPHLGAMRFLAFGDSTTAGENGIDFPGDSFPEVFIPAPCGTTSVQSAGRALNTGRAQPQFFDPTTSYPAQLLGLLKARFSGEAFAIENEGNPGERAADGVKRLVACFQTGDRPDVMLLLEGINDIAQSAVSYQPDLTEEQAIVRSLRNDVTNAINAGVAYVFVSTILPVSECYVGPDQPQPCRVGDVGDPTVPNVANGYIDQVNAMIRTTVGGVTIVDGNAAFRAADPTLATLIDEDGLHPTPAGYGLLAQAWMNALVSHIPITSLHSVRR
jgi:lysophospholipase L1-like esterase